jgi:AhpD family alkylhydroperoxidase
MTTTPNLPKNMPKVAIHRTNVMTAAPKVVQALLQVSATPTSIEKSLHELVKIRASQINGCAYCLTMHTRDARAMGESEERMHLLSAWREAPSYFTPRERAALAWTECLTLVAEKGAPDDVYEAFAAEFSEQEQAELTLLVCTINVWNRFNVGFRAEPQAEPRAEAPGAVAA